MFNPPIIAAQMLREYGNRFSKDELKELYANAGDLKKVAQYIGRLGGPYNIREAELFSKALGNMDDEHDFNASDSWDEDTLDKYASYVHNYKYQYNDEALKVDPSIDTQKEHIGPMAQDLEKVNPATVKEDPKSGYKTVDTGRLALMNAGAIAELARRIKNA